MNQTNNSKEGYVTLKMDEFLPNTVDTCIRKRAFDASSSQISSSGPKNANQQPVFQCYI